MEIAIKAMGLDVLPVDADAQVDQAFRLSGVMSGQIAVRIQPDNLPAALQQFAAGTQQSPLPAWVCCQRTAQAPSKLHLSATSQPSLLNYNLSLMRQLLCLIGNEELVVTGTLDGLNDEMIVFTLS